MDKFCYNCFTKTCTFINNSVYIGTYIYLIPTEILILILVNKNSVHYCRNFYKL